MAGRFTLMHTLLGGGKDNKQHVINGDEAK